MPSGPRASREPLVGRAREVERLGLQLDAVEHGAPRVVTLTGEPGIGKTRLLRELLESAAGRGAIALDGRAAEFERDVPFGVWIDALDARAAALDRGRLNRLADDRRAELAAMLPGLADLGPGRADPPAGGYRAARAVGELLEEIAGARTLVIALDDVHWADPGSIELIAALLRRPPQMRLLLAIALRPVRLAPELSQAIAYATRDERLERIEPAPLARADAESLLEPGTDRARRDTIVRESGGNPFYLLQLARAPRASRSAVALHDTATTIGALVPAAVAEALNWEIEALDPAARRLAEGAAVTGEPFGLDLAAEVAELDESAALDALDALLGTGLARETEVPRRFAFRHPLVRRAVYEGAGGGWRLGAHARAAAVLARQGASAAERARHIEYSARTGDEDAIVELTAAGREARGRAPATAARWYGAALRLLPARDRERRLELLDVLAEALEAAGRLERSRQALLEALQLTPGADAARRTDLVRRCAGVEHWLGRHTEARARLLGAIGDLPDPHAPEAIGLKLELAFDALYGYDLARTQEVARETLEAARAAGRPALASAAGALLALGLAAAGSLAEAERERSAARELLDGLAPSDLEARPDILWAMAWADTFLDRYEDGIAHSTRGVEICRATGQGRVIVPLMVASIFPLWMTGRLDEAIEVGAEAVETARLTGISHHLVWALWEKGAAELLRDPPAAARRTVEEAMEAARDVERIMLWESEPEWLHGMVMIEEGDHAAGAELLKQACGGDDVVRVVPAERVLALEMLAQAYAAAGDGAAAADAAARAERSAAEIARPVCRALALRARAHAELAAGRPAEAATAALASAAGLDAITARIEAARTRLLAGRALAAAGSRDEAIGELRRAEQELAAAGAERHRETAQRELRALGVRVTRGPGGSDGGLAELSDREGELATLVEQGLTNREIAERLFLSQKTVETHLRNIFVKLRVSSRREVARVVRDERRAATAPRP